MATFPLAAGYPKFIFRAGKKQKDVDPLSRIKSAKGEDSPSDLDEYFENLVADPMEVRINLIRMGWEPYDSIARWLNGGGLDHLNDVEAARIRRMALKFCIIDGRLYRRVHGMGALRKVPRIEEVEGILEEAHGSVVSHLSECETYQVIAQRWYWHGIFKHVKAHVQSCAICAVRRLEYETGAFQLYRIVPPTTIFMLLGCDTVALPRSSAKHRGIFTLID